MPARHESLLDSLLFEADEVGGLWSTKEGVGETSGQTAGSYFPKSSFGKAGPAEETGFLRSVRILKVVRNFIGPTAHLPEGSGEIWS